MAKISHTTVEEVNSRTDMVSLIGEYTRPRCVTQQDIEDLLNLSIKDAIDDGIALLEGSIDIGFIRNCDYKPEQFLTMISNIVEKFTKIGSDI